MASVPKTMSGILIEETGDASVLKWKTDLSVPELTEGQILVKNEWAGVNYIDTYFRTGLYKGPMPMILGGEAAGVVAAVHPSVTGFKEGDQIMYMSMTRGSYAQYNAIKPDMAIKLPEHVTTRTAAASLLQGLTALTFVREAHAVKPSDWVLIHAAAGGTGSIKSKEIIADMGVQVCELCASIGAKVIGTAGSPEKMETARRNGAKWVISSRKEPREIIEEVMRITEGHGADAVFDGVGAATFDADLQLVARKGTICVFGNASGPVPPVDVLRLGPPKNVKLCRPNVFVYLSGEGEFVQYATELMDFIEKGVVKLEQVTTYPLEDAATAHRDLESRKMTGKLVLQVP